MRKHTWTMHFKLYADDDRVELPVALRIRDALRDAGAPVALEVQTMASYFALTAYASEQDFVPVFDALSALCRTENVFFDHASCVVKRRRRLTPK